MSDKNEITLVNTGFSGGVEEKTERVRAVGKNEWQGLYYGENANIMKEQKAVKLLDK